MAQFEARFVDRYESILGRLPDDVVLGRRELVDPTIAELRVFHDYYALCDEEVFYRAKGRVTLQTWRDWERGMELNLERASFNEAWKSLCSNDQLDARFAEFQPNYDKLKAQQGFDPRPRANQRLLANMLRRSSRPKRP